MGNGAGEVTRERIMVTAERMMAERGFTDVPLRAIGEAAGQRNTAATHYHFRDRDGLIRAIFDHRCAQLRARAEGILVQVTRDTPPRSEARSIALLDIFTIPLVEQWQRGYFLAFIARLPTEALQVRPPLFEPWAQFVDWVLEAFRAVGSDLADDELEFRVGSALVVTIHMMAAAQLYDDAPWVPGTRAFDQLARVQAAILLAPAVDGAAPPSTTVWGRWRSSVTTVDARA